MRAFALALLLVAMPAGAQWRIPDKLPPLPEDGAACNETHCLVNRSDWLTLQLAMQIAGKELADRDAVIEQLSRALEVEQARAPHCAEVRKVPVPGLKRTSW